MEIVGVIISKISETLWNFFLPILVLAALYIGYKTLFTIKNKTTVKSKITMKQVIGPTSISLGAMIGTGAIIGVLGALNKYVAAGQIHPEAIVFWTLIGMVIMVPLSYSETLISKVMGKVPEDMATEILGKTIAKVYAVCFVILYVFGFGGFQFSGIGSFVSLIGEQFTSISLDANQRYIYIVIPLIIITSLIVLSKKHDVFINAMASLIGVSVVLYIMFFIVFIIKTNEFVPIFLNNMIEGIKDPVQIFIGLPLGIVLAIQRIIQTAESGIGGLPMAAHETDSEPRAAAIISLIPVIITIFVAIIVTTYIVSYGMNQGILELPSGDFERLTGFFNTVYSVTGNLGIIILFIFAIGSGTSTLLGSYYYVKVLFRSNSENKNIGIYILLLVISGTLATFGFDVAFELVDLLIFIVTIINVLTILLFTKKHWEKYKIN